MGDQPDKQDVVLTGVDEKPIGIVIDTVGDDRVIVQLFGVSDDALTVQRENQKLLKKLLAEADESNQLAKQQNDLLSEIARELKRRK